jgi:hypothetical protein
MSRQKPGTDDGPKVRDPKRKKRVAGDSKQALEWWVPRHRNIEHAIDKLQIPPELFRKRLPAYDYRPPGPDQWRRIMSGRYKPAGGFIWASAQVFAELDLREGALDAKQWFKFIDHSESEVHNKHIERRTTTYAGGIAYHLTRLGVHRNRTFEEAGLFSKNNSRLCVDNVISLHLLNGSEGLPGSLIRVRETNGPPKLPRSVVENVGRVLVSGADRIKAFLTKTTLMPTDEDEGITIEVAPAKYSIRRAMQHASETIQNELIAQKLKLSDDPIYDSLEKLPNLLPCALHCDGVVITGDQKVLMAQRGRDANVGAMEWAVSTGEGMEWDKDRDHSGTLTPARTLWRGLKEELGLNEEWVKEEYKDSTTIRFLGLAFDLSTMLTFFSTVIEFPELPAGRALERARHHAKECGRENQDYATMEFTPEACASAVVTGVVSGRKLIDTARFNLLLASLHKFASPFEDALASFQKN